MPDLKPSTALGGETARVSRHGAFELEENAGLALASLALRWKTAKPAPFGLDLPGPGAWVQAGEVAAFWISPDQWMIEGQGRADSDFAADVAALCPGCSVTEQTDGFVAFEVRSLEGEVPILRLMSKLVNIDPARLPAGSATRTGLEHMSVFVVRRSVNQLTIVGMRSAAAFLWHFLDATLSRLSASMACTSQTN